ncbi:MAG: monofunctional biosynthetic peptidoglycan transglycosylase [Betaproteobacteria bacterium]|nr:monofunctional biosynthetic peptidoglycan transglycosylase [Betaproteobacteria bacterium]
MLRFLWRWTWRLVLLAIGLVLAYQLWFYGHVVFWKYYNPAGSSFMEQRLETLHEKKPDARLKHQWVPYGKISSHLKRAIIAAEDGKFLEHEGFDFDAIQKAYEKNLKKGKVVAGGSTISQQLAKNLFLSAQRTPWRKAQEAVITLMLEYTWDKRRILEVYLNIIEWGNGVFGAEAAARHYFGASAAGLSAEQAARLAAMVPNPRYYDRRRDSPYLARRTELILARMSAAQVP